MYADTVKQFAIEHGLTESEGVNFSAEITHQIVDNLNDLGIETHGSKDMEEDLRGREEEKQRDELSSTIDKARLGDEEAIEELQSYGIPIGNAGVYRFVSEEEANNIMNGGKYNGRFDNGMVDVTSSQSPTTAANASYHITFKSKYDLYKEDGRTRLKNEELGDGYIEGGYTLDDVAVIEKMNEDGSWEVVYENTESPSNSNIGTFSAENDDIQFAFAGSQLTFAHGIRRPHREDLMLLSSAIMTQSNTFGKLTSELADKNDGTIVKKVILYGNHAYLWSTENGYEFFVEQSLAINEENYQKINDLLDTYGTDEFTAAVISGIQRSGDKKTGSRSLADFAKRERSGENSGPIGRNSRRLSEISNGTGDNGYNLSDTQGKTNFITPQGQVYGYATPKGAIYLDERVIKKSRTCVRDFFIKACPPGQPDCLL